MNDVRDKKSVLAQFLHRHLLKLIVLSYGLAAIYPLPGLWIKEADVLELFGISGSFSITSPKLLLWLLLWSAGLRVRPGRIGDLRGGLG